MNRLQPWTAQEDQMLIQLHNQAGCFQRWKFISQKMKEKGISKTQFQCRDRYTNHVDPSIKHGKLSQAQIIKLFSLYDQYGPRWSYFQSKIVGRPQNLLKNKFYSTLRSLLRHIVKTGQKRNLHRGSIDSSNLSSKLLTNLYEGRKSTHLNTIKFIYCKGILKNCLKSINFCIDRETLQNYLSNIGAQILSQLFIALANSTKTKESQQLANEKQEQSQNKEENQENKKEIEVDEKCNIAQGQQMGNKYNQQQYTCRPYQSHTVTNGCASTILLFPLDYWSYMPTQYPSNIIAWNGGQFWQNY